MLLEFDFIVGVFYAKMSNSRSFWAPFIYCNLGPLYFRLKPKMQKPALDCCWICWNVSKMECHNLIAQKLTKNIGSLEIVPWGWVTNTTFVVYWLWKFGQDSIFLSKVIQFVPTDRHTTFIPIGGDKNFYPWKFMPFHFTTFICLLCSLIHSVCKG